MPSIYLDGLLPSPSIFSSLPEEKRAKKRPNFSQNQAFTNNLMRDICMNLLCLSVNHLLDICFGVGIDFRIAKVANATTASHTGFEVIFGVAL